MISQRPVHNPRQGRRLGRRIVEGLEGEAVTEYLMLGPCAGAFAKLHGLREVTRRNPAIDVGAALAGAPADFAQAQQGQGLAGCCRGQHRRLFRLGHRGIPRNARNRTGLAGDVGDAVADRVRS